MDEIKSFIIGQLAPYLKCTDKAFNEDLLSSIVDGVLIDARMHRRYPSSYTEEMIERDMLKGVAVFRNVALLRYNKIGMEFQTSHSEGDVSRHFPDSNKEWSGWFPLSVCA